MSKEKTKIKKFYIGVEPMILKNGNSDDRNSFNRVYKDIFDHLTNDDNKYESFLFYLCTNPALKLIDIQHRQKLFLCSYDAVCHFYHSLDWRLQPYF